MSLFFIRLASLPGTALGVAASFCFASSHVWAQSAPDASNARPAAVSATSRSIGESGSTALIDGRVLNVVIVGAKGDSLEVTYANTGSAATVIMGAVQIHVGNDSIATTVPFAADVTVEPGVTRRFRMRMPKLTKGRYTLLAIVDFGADTMTAAQATLDIR